MTHAVLNDSRCDRKPFTTDNYRMIRQARP